MPRKKYIIKKPKASGKSRQGRAFLMKLSPEVRLMIFDYLVPTDGFVEIYTPFKRAQLGRSLPISKFAQDFMNLRLVNKKIYLESSSLFYSRNTFCMGNGAWGSCVSINLQALKRFVNTVPPQHLAQIRLLGMALYLRERIVKNFKYVTSRFEFDQFGLRTLARTMLKHFPAVTDLVFYVPIYAHDELGYRDAWYNDIDKWPSFFKHQKWPAFIQMLLSHEKLQRIVAEVMFNNNNRVLRSLQRILENSDAAGRVLITQSRTKSRSYKARDRSKQACGLA